MNYWQRRDLKERVRLFNMTEDDLRKILKREYLRIYKEVRTELLNLINTLPANPTANDIYTEDKLYKLLNELQYKLDNLAQFEKNAMENTFTNYYIANSELVGETTNLPMDNARAVRAINSVWAGDGKNYSDRIWSNKRALLESLRKGLLDTVATGRNWATFSKQLQKDFGVAYSQSKRLVRTELSHIQNESTLDKYEQEGVKQVRFVAELDSDTCEECSKYDKKIYDIRSAPIIPCHPNCRCTYIAIVDLTPEGD